MYLKFSSLANDFWEQIHSRRRIVVGTQKRQNGMTEERLRLGRENWLAKAQMRSPSTTRSRNGWLFLRSSWLWDKVFKLWLLKYILACWLDWFDNQDSKFAVTPNLSAHWASGTTSIGILPRAIQIVKRWHPVWKLLSRSPNRWLPFNLLCLQHKPEL